MNVFIRTLLFLSAIAPAVVVAAIKKLFASGGSAEVYGLMIAGLLSCLFPLLLIRTAAAQCEVIAFSAKKVESQEWLLVVIIVSYFVPLVATLEDLRVLAFVSILAAAVLATLEAVPNHPILHLFRYRFYKVEGTNGMVYFLITGRRLLSASAIKSVRQLSPQLLLEA